jgi:hypothetical protein
LVGRARSGLFLGEPEFEFELGFPHHGQREREAAARA